MAYSETLTNTESQKMMAAYQKASKSQASGEVFQKVERILETVIKDYSDCTVLSQNKEQERPTPALGKQAAVELYECRYLEIGKIAPEIEGEGIDGKKLKLSDYRGKVVVICFWATWCGPCMQMVPHEREMAQKWEGKPFAILGVNGDEIQVDAQRIAIKEKMTWGSFWDKGSDGPISTTWNVSGWPMVYVLDTMGKIRFKDGGYSKFLEESVERLMNESTK